MAKGDYYFPLYYKRLLASTIGWKDDEFGAYVRLLISQFDNNNQIPNDLDELTLIAPSIKKNWKRISKKFSKNEDGTMYNPVMSDIFNDVQHKKTKRAEIGRLGGRPKNQLVNQTETKNKPIGFDLLNQNESYPITNNQQPITNSTKDIENNVVAANHSEIPPPASTTTNFLNIRYDKLYEFFNRASRWNPEKITIEIGRFENKYSHVPINQCGGLINKWIANDNGASQDENNSGTAKKMVI